MLVTVDKVGEIARWRGQTMMQLALFGVLRPEITPAVIDVLNLDQLEDNLSALYNLDLNAEQITDIDESNKDV